MIDSERLAALYGVNQAGRVREQLERLAPEVAVRPDWSAADTVLITYGGSLRREGEAPLTVLRAFAEQRLTEAFSTIHVLPFFPYSSDDGFSVVDFLAVDPELGTWADIGALGDRFELAIDLVLNHVSQQSQWFEEFVAGVEPGRSFIKTASPTDDLRAVVRPRTHRLLRPVDTADGVRHVWCTFSHDQVDLDFENPDVLVAMAAILQHYVEHGAGILRLDAVAYTWKEVGTDCIHRPQVHNIVQVLRDVLGGSAKLLTETNVPLPQNLAYFGAVPGVDGEPVVAEADAIYNFSLPPLMLDAFVRSDTKALGGWLDGLPAAPSGGAYLNFLASHDGIGLRPVEGILSLDQVDALVAVVRNRGGFVSDFATPDGPRPYELNVSLISALGGVEPLIAAHAAVFAIAGVPAVYVHSLFATPNDLAGAEATGRHRSINRAVLDIDAVELALADPTTDTSRAFTALTHMLEIRRQQSAFDPAAKQGVVESDPNVLVFWRRSEHQHVDVAINVSAFAQPNPIPAAPYAIDLLTEASPTNVLAPFQAMWVATER